MTGLIIAQYTEKIHVTPTGSRLHIDKMVNRECRKKVSYYEPERLSLHAACLRPGDIMAGMTGYTAPVEYRFDTGREVSIDAAVVTSFLAQDMDRRACNRDPVCDGCLVVFPV